MPFETLDGLGVADVLHLVPWCRFWEVLRVLQALANDVPNKGLANAPSVNDHLHSLCKRLRNVRYWLPQRYDANSGRDNNPLYRMVGRREQTRGRMERYIKSRGRTRPSNAMHRSCRSNGTAAALCREHCPPHPAAGVRWNGANGTV